MAKPHSPQIILIDDDHGPMDYYVEALQMKGFEIKHIDTADEAWEMLDPKSKMKEPSLFVIDIMMPYGRYLTSPQTNEGMLTGVFLVERCRAKFPKVEIVCLTNLRPAVIREQLPEDVKCFAKYEASPVSFAKIVEGLLGIMKY